MVIVKCVIYILITEKYKKKIYELIIYVQIFRNRVEKF